MPKINKNELVDILNKCISVSELSRGMASKIIQNVSKNKEQYIIMKNNKPEAVILSLEDYTELLDAKEELELLKMANERVSKETFGHEETLKRYNISEEKIDNLIEKIKIE
jgi:prevent-host-death family protein